LVACLDEKLDELGLLASGNVTFIQRVIRVLDDVHPIHRAELEIARVEVQNGLLGIARAARDLADVIRETGFDLFLIDPITKLDEPRVFQKPLILGKCFHELMGDGPDTGFSANPRVQRRSFCCEDEAGAE
jgi:hypothetical protein